TASIAHEVRQPLTSIVASADTAMHSLDRSPPDHEKIRNAVNRIIRESQRTSAVFDSIRALFERADREHEAVDVNEIVRAVLQSLDTEMTDGGIAAVLDLAELPPVFCYPNQLQQVVFNLVKNALEAMQVVVSRSRVLRVRTECHGSAAVAIVVEDTGPGLDAAQVNSIFAAFVTTKSHGMGLGLAICRQIVDHHGGRLL